MAKSFTAREVRKLLRQHGKIKEGLKKFDDAVASYRLQALGAANVLLSREAYRQLQKISIDEINREKKGFRVKALYDCGYHTIADICGASAESIASVRGIGQESAQAICNKVFSLTGCCVSCGVIRSEGITRRRDAFSEAQPGAVLPAQLFFMA